MEEDVARYKRFIDGLVEIAKSSPHAGSLREGRKLFELPIGKQRQFNEFVAELTPQQREVLLELLVNERSGAIHDVLSFMTWQEYHLSQQGITLADEPFYTESFYDFIARFDGDAWPDERDER